MKKLIVLTTIFLLTITSLSFAVSKKADMGNVGSCMRECVQTVNPSANDVYATDISVDEFTLDCVNYCNPNLKDGYCSPEADECCNVMYQENDPDCSTTYNYTFSGEIIQVNPPLSDDPIYTFIEGERYTGTLEFKHEETPYPPYVSQTIEILSFNIDFENSEDISLDNFSYFYPENSQISTSTVEHLQAQVYGEGMYLGKRIFYMILNIDLYNNFKDVSIAFEDWEYTLLMNVDSGTIMEYPKYSYWPNLPSGAYCTHDYQCASNQCNIPLGQSVGDCK